MPGEVQTTAHGLQALMPEPPNLLASRINYSPTQNDSLHPYVSTLGLADLESCVALENAAFPENERVCVPFLFLLLKLESASSSALLGPLRNIVALMVVADNVC